PSVGFSRPPWFSELDSRPFVGIAHLFLMSSMLARVVNVLPAICSTRRLLRSISRRRPDTPMLPSGNAICAAMSRRSGVVGVIVSGDGTRFGVFALCFCGCLIEQPSLRAASAGVRNESGGGLCTKSCEVDGGETGTIVPVSAVGRGRGEAGPIIPAHNEGEGRGGSES